MIYLIGGPARCGKSTLARRVRREVDAQVISGDAFRHSLIEQLTPEWFPALFVIWARFNAMRSRLMIDLCKKYGYPYFDIKEHGMEGSQTRAFDYLLRRAI